MNKEIFSTKNFTVVAYEKPLVTRKDGGHVAIVQKEKVWRDRTELSPSIAIELMRLTMVTGEAMVTALNKRGIDVGRINYQDNGNWAVFTPEGSFLHVHLYGRARSAVTQKYGDTLNHPHRETGFYDSCEPLNDGDIAAMQAEIGTIFKREKYQDLNWHL